MAKNKLLMNKKTADTEFVKQIAQQTPEEALKTLHSSLDGLSSTEAKERLEKNGLNEVATKKHNTKLHFFIESFFTPFTMVLLLLATVSLFTDYVFVPADQKDLSTVIIMITMIIISGLTSFIQNVKTNDAVEDLLNMVSVTTNIRRNKKDKEISTKQVVVGDIINIHAGDMVPADIRLLQTKDLFCSSSSLNGESTPVEKIATKKPDQKDMDQYLDYPDVIYQGTTIVSGSGVGVVLATGEQTVFGRLAKDISNNDVKETNFDVGIKNISKLLLTMTAIIAPLVLIINGLTKGNWLNALLFAIATAVGLTPEMLPVIVTSNLVKGSLEMSKHGTIVKKMNSIQNFGAADILCTDKTGTLTEDKIVLEKYLNVNGEEDYYVLKQAFLNAPMENVEDIVICGFGEPTMRLDDLVKLLTFIHQTYPKFKVRMNTNGLSDLEYGKKTAVLFKGLLNTISISLNESNAEKYLEVTRSRFGIKSYKAMLDFAVDCKNYIPNVVVTIVDIIGEDEINACKKVCEEYNLNLRIRRYEAN